MNTIFLAHKHSQVKSSTSTNVIEALCKFDGFVFGACRLKKVVHIKVSSKGVGHFGF